MIKESKSLMSINKILSNLFNEKYWLKMLEFNNITGTERVNPEYRQEQQKKKPEICCKIKIRLKKHRSHCLFYQ